MKKARHTTPQNIEKHQGQSLVPVLEGNTPEDWRKTFYYHYYEYPGRHYVRKYYGVTDGHFKLIHFYETDVDSWELYNLHNDRAVLHNMIDNQAYMQVEKRLQSERSRLRKELRVPAQEPASTVITKLPPRVRKPLP